MNVLITGVAGFLGSHLADACLDRGWQVTGLDNLFRGRPEHMPEHPAFRFETLDLCTDVEAIAALIKETRPDLILHYGAINGTEYFYERPWSVLDTNVSSTVQLLKAIEASGHAPDRLAYASSSEVYGESLIGFPPMSDASRSSTSTRFETPMPPPRPSVISMSGCSASR